MNAEEYQAAKLLAEIVAAKIYNSRAGRFLSWLLHPVFYTVFFIRRLVCRHEMISDKLCDDMAAMAAAKFTDGKTRKYFICKKCGKFDMKYV
jgi:hypothetical protein